MTGVIVDKRTCKSRSAPNRKAFIDRYKDVLKGHVERLANSKNRSITDVAKKREITINRKDLEEPSFGYDKDEGRWDRVLPGNKKYINGDRIPIPNNGQGKGNGAGQGDGEESLDEFVFTLTEEEFYDILFDGLALPDFIKNGMKITEFSHIQRAGYKKEGSPCQLDLKKTFENAMARRIATKDTDTTKEVPYLDDIDLRYKNYLEVSKPSRHALMFCILDVSGSMDDVLKARAKKYFLLLYVFLKKTYNSVEVVFIRHHDTAKEVTEKEFFYDKETGGTTISAALQLTSDIIDQRYSSDDINIYVSQASDGDNWTSDSGVAVDILSTKILPRVQYYTYLEVVHRNSGYETWNQTLWKEVVPYFKNIKTRVCTSDKDIFPIFRELFKAN